MAFFSGNNRKERACWIRNLSPEPEVRSSNLLWRAICAPGVLAERAIYAPDAFAERAVCIRNVLLVTPLASGMIPRPRDFFPFSFVGHAISLHEADFAWGKNKRGDPSRSLHVFCLFKRALPRPDTGPRSWPPALKASGARYRSLRNPPPEDPSSAKTHR